ncbi:hypothetical protein L6164_007244 [Bauhinia variegata]|uniref:Uncharacterized protein n=1 Tax=Bauhinia variegata TaxID=167791 RepID=A0ACB9PEF0_BAUVA|nr:hypothetical protein L6164_007244 [Bauhinia variegata]
MHIWPSVSIREKFKYAYLNKLEWNLQKMKREKEREKQKQKQSSLNDKLLANQNDSQADEAPKQEDSGGIVAFCNDFLLVLSCCYCCFCCGACVEEK